jgi:hypothetical protein
MGDQYLSVRGIVGDRRAVKCSAQQKVGFINFGTTIEQGF